MFLLATIDKTFSFKTFPFSSARFLDLEGFTDIGVHDRAATHGPNGIEYVAKRETKGKGHP